MYVARPEPSPICGVYEGAGLRQRVVERDRVLQRGLLQKQQRQRCRVHSKRLRGPMGGKRSFAAGTILEALAVEGVIRSFGLHLAGSLVKFMQIVRRPT